LPEKEVVGGCGDDSNRRAEEGESLSPNNHESSNAADLVASKTKEEEEGDLGDYKGPEKSSLWLIGTITFATGSIFTFAAFGFAAQSLLASLESVQFISNVIFAKTVHKQTITTRMLLATLSILAGNVLVVIFSDHEEQLLNSVQIINLFLTNTAYHGYLAR